MVQQIKFLISEPEFAGFFLGPFSSSNQLLLKSVHFIHDSAD